VIRFGLHLCLVIFLAGDGLTQTRPPKSPVKARAKVDSQSGPKASRAAVSKPRPRLSKRQVRQALAFARLHHPELAKLIERLRSVQDRTAYDKAVAELSKTAQRLESLKESNFERYGMMLELWKLESQARLMVARSMMKPDPKRDAQLRETLRKRAELRRIMLLADIKRSQARIDRIESQLKSLENLDAATDRELQRLKRSARIAATRTKGRSGKQPPKTVVPVKSGTGKPGKPSKTTVKTTVKTKGDSKP
jgi:hypothetical protein